MSTETRFHDRATFVRKGRRLASITCPFCGVVTEAHLWSLAGSGKRCDCGAVHHYHPAATYKEKTT